MFLVCAVDKACFLTVKERSSVNLNYTTGGYKMKVPNQSKGIERNISARFGIAVKEVRSRPSICPQQVANIGDLTGIPKRSKGWREWACAAASGMACEPAIAGGYKNWTKCLDFAYDHCMEGEKHSIIGPRQAFESVL